MFGSPASAPSQSQPTPATPAYIQQAYDLTYLSQTKGVGDTVAIVDAYDDPNAEADLGVYRSTYGLPPCTTANGCFKKVNENGATSPLPAGDKGWEGEIALDLSAVSAVCPNCHILLVEAYGPYYNDLNNAFATAAHMGANQISNSWAGEDTVAEPDAYSSFGVPAVFATGDSGYNSTLIGGNTQDSYPAGLPNVIAAAAPA